MRKDSPLAQKETIAIEDLYNLPLIVSRQMYKRSDFQEAIKNDESKLNIVATYNLLYNGSLMVEEGIGYALCFDKIINTSGDSNLCFKPLYPKMEAGMAIIWKRYQVFSKAAQKFLKKIQENISTLSEL